MRPNRRVLLGGAAALGATALAGLAPLSAAPTGLFSLGVASGDPLPDGVVLWTRLAPEPLAPDGLGGMPGAPVPVEWQVAADERFSRVERSGSVLAMPEDAHSVHVEVSGLRPGAWYFYRFRAGGQVSPAGRTRTAPDAGLRRLAFAFASCQHYADGFYTAHAHLAEEELDLVVFLGDYIYEGGSQGSLGRGHRPAHELRTLADYRVRFAQYKSDANLQAAHAAFPWIAVFDDHEVQNNWAGDHSDTGVPRAEFRARRAAAFQAYYEHLPLRRAQRPTGPDIRIHRRLTFGDLVDFHVLDTRQYRSPAHTMLGPPQKDWLFHNLAGPTARWNVLAQQVFFTPLRPGASADTWYGCPAERNEVRDHLAHASSPVIITGDAHDFDDPASPVVATEFVGTSIRACLVWILTRRPG
ncbi:alkaline phosphatase D family protein [Amycolatopsis sacchari]|uniref:alkaline phosphatase D family protein n=1 Tax=Amycolatopsis sacchari TaxID=115433 RepID=UPI003EB8D607